MNTAKLTLNNGRFVPLQFQPKSLDFFIFGRLNSTKVKK